jgi:uncharacterized membrane protein
VDTGSTDNVITVRAAHLRIAAWLVAAISVVLFVVFLAVSAYQDAQAEKNDSARRTCEMSAVMRGDSLAEAAQQCRRG